VEVRSYTVILSPFAVILSAKKDRALPLRVDYAQGPCGSYRLSHRANYGSSSPKMRAQNDSVSPAQVHNDRPEAYSRSLQSRQDGGATASSQ